MSRLSRSRELPSVQPLPGSILLTRTCNLSVYCVSGLCRACSKVNIKTFTQPRSDRVPLRAGLDCTQPLRLGSKNRHLEYIQRIDCNSIGFLTQS